VKTGSYFLSLGHQVEKILIDELNKYNLPHDKVFIESFDKLSLQRLRKLTNYNLLQLIGTPGDDTGEDFTGMVTEAGLAQIATYANGIGPDKTLIYQSVKQDGPNLIQLAHKNNLVVHPFTLRADNPHGKGAAIASFEEELLILFELGVDGVFSDHPDKAVKIRDNFLKRKSENIPIRLEELLQYII